ETPLDVLVVASAGVHDLQRDDAVELQVDRAVHNPHAAAADDLIDVVTWNVRELRGPGGPRLTHPLGVFGGGLAPGVARSRGGGHGPRDGDRVGRGVRGRGGLHPPRGTLRAWFGVARGG